MGCIRPATPGFLITLVATALLAVVSFCVPYFKSVYFLKATIAVSGHNGTITFGTLGYCLELSNGTTCSSPSIGYQLDINGLVGNKLPISIPQVAVKWITYALFLHVIALAGAAISAVFGLLAHVREMSMTCCSTFVSGFAAVVAMFAFIFDLILFFVAKARINAVGTAQMGNAIWLTLAAWLLLFFSGCFYTLGRCCIQKRSGGKGGKWGSKDDPERGPNKDYAEQVRLDAVKAEADRKARERQQKAEGGLPAFYETQPLTGRVEGDHVYVDGDGSESQAHLTASAVPPAGRQHAYAGGYVQGAPGTRTMDDYYNPSPASPPPNTYPLHDIRRQPSGYAPSTYTANVPHSPISQHSLPPQSAAYGSTPYSYNAPLTTSPPLNQHLALPGQYPQDAYGRDYGHSAGGTSYHTAASHEQQPSGYTQYDPFTSQQNTRYAEPSYNPDTYHNNAPMNPPMPSSTNYPAMSNPYYTSASPPPPQPNQHDRSYTLGGDGYGASSVPPPQEYDTPAPYGYYGAPAHTHSPPPINTDVGYIQTAPQTSPVRGPRAQPGTVPEDSPPGYETGTSGVTGNWGKR